MVNDCNLKPLSYLQHHKYPTRIIIHPTSGNTIRNWPASKYIKLAKLLAAQGWQPLFCLAPAERKTWASNIDHKFLMPNCATISELAGFVYESGYMIGNDSGIGHLASSLGIPTLTIINRHNHFHWRPGWAIGRTVTPVFKLPKLHKKYWPYLISVTRVLKTFQQQF